MATLRPEVVTFNRGEVAKTALARVDLAQMRLAAELQRNFVPKTYGPMLMRPPLEFLEPIAEHGARSKMVPFVFSMEDMALVEFCRLGMRFWRERDGVTVGEHPGDLIERLEPIQRGDAGASFVNGNWLNGLAGWSTWVSGSPEDAPAPEEDNGASFDIGDLSDWLNNLLNGLGAAQTGGGSSGSTITPIYPTAVADGRGLVLNVIPRGGSVRVWQTIPIGAGRAAVGVRIDVTRGPVIFRVNTPAGPAVFDTELDTGYHSIVLPPDLGDYTFEFESRLQREIIVKSIAFEPAGPLLLPYYADGGYNADYYSGDFANLKRLRWYQSGDQMFMAREKRAPSILERRSRVSFSHVIYRPEDGPFSADVTVKQVKLRVDVTEGNGHIFADRPFFRAGHLNALFEVFNQNYNQTFTLGASNAYTDPMRVTGTCFIQNDQLFSERWIVTNYQGFYDGSAYHMVSRDDPDGGYKVKGDPYAANMGRNTFTKNNASINKSEKTTDFITDNNAINFHKFGFRDGTYRSGSLTVNQQYPWGGGKGRCRITRVVSSTECEIEVLKPFFNSTFSDFWKEGEWSDYRGWPTAVGITESRLFWAKGDQMYGSVSDNYVSHDIEANDSGDSAAISRSVSTTGTVDNIRFILPMSRLVVGTEGSISSIRSSSFDEPLTGGAFTPRPATTHGTSPDVQPCRLDARAIYAHRSETRLMEFSYSPQVQDYQARDLNLLNDEILEGVDAIAIQRQPDTRVHAIRPDGTVAMFMTDFLEEVDCWSTVETDGVIEDVAVLPAKGEDAVYYIVRRTTADGTRRYLEKWAREKEGRGGLVGGDCFVRSPSAADAFRHLEGKHVVALRGDEVLADGSEYKPYGTISNGRLMLDGAAVVVSADLKVGLPYRARYKSPKLAYGGRIGTALLQKKAVKSFGFALAHAHRKALRYGPDFGLMDPMPTIEGDEIQAEDAVYTVYDAPMGMWGGGFDTDSRICLECAAPYSAAVLGTIFGITTNES